MNEKKKKKRRHPSYSLGNLHSDCLHSARFRSYIYHTIHGPSGPPGQKQARRCQTNQICSRGQYGHGNGLAPRVLLNVFAPLKLSSSPSTSPFSFSPSLGSITASHSPARLFLSCVRLPLCCSLGDVCRGRSCIRSQSILDGFEKDFPERRFVTGTRSDLSPLHHPPLVLFF